MIPRPWFDLQMRDMLLEEKQTLVHSLAVATLARDEIATAKFEDLIRNLIRKRAAQYAPRFRGLARGEDPVYSSDDLYRDGLAYLIQGVRNQPVRQLRTVASSPLATWVADPKRPLGFWMAAHIDWYFRDLLRGERKRRRDRVEVVVVTDEDGDEICLLDELPAEANDALDNVLLREWYEKAWAALDERLARVVTLRYRDDVLQDEIAEILQTTPGTISKWLKEAKKELMERLEESDPELYARFVLRRRTA